jgi:hypothetical protein
MGDVARRCQKCGYSLAGLAAARCPECGTDVSYSDQRGVRTKLRLMAAGMWACSLIVVLIGGHGAGPLALFLLLPFLESYHNAAAFALVLHVVMIVSSVLWLISLFVPSVAGTVALSLVAECVFVVTVFLVACYMPETFLSAAITVIPNVLLAIAFVRSAKRGFVRTW